MPAIVAFHAPGMVFENHTAGERVEGDAVAGHLEQIFRNWPDLTFRGRRAYVRDGLVVNEWTASATDDQGRRLEWDGVDIFPFEGGLILRKDVYSVVAPPPRGRSLERELTVRREAGHADADEAQRAGPVAQAAIEKAAGDVADDAGLVDSRRQGRRARADREVSVAKLRGHSATGQARVAQPLGDELGETSHLDVQVRALGDVARERVLGRNGDRLAGELEIARIDPAGAIPEEYADESREAAS